MSDGKSVKINTTDKIEAGSVLGSTLDGMEEFDMNVVNDTGGSHGFNNPKKGSKS